LVGLPRAAKQTPTPPTLLSPLSFVQQNLKTFSTRRDKKFKELQPVRAAAQYYYCTGPGGGNTQESDRPMATQRGPGRYLPFCQKSIRMIAPL
jgi:hypothetical protein